ncbi:MAG: hypothetical protein AB4372_20660 [Xenococcus sp. (in: cyanobacteria)]
MKKLLTNLSLFVALGIGGINVEYVEASSGLSQCFNSQVKFNILAKAEMKQSDYYLVDIIYNPRKFETNVIKVDTSGKCSTVVDSKQIGFYPLSNFLGQEIAYNLLTSRYLTLIQELGGVEALTNAILGELDADAPKNFFEDTVIVLKRLGIDLKEEVPNLIIVGEEGIPGHPNLQFGK